MSQRRVSYVRPDTEPDIYTAHDVARRYQCSLRTAYEILDTFEVRGQLLQHGRLRRIRRAVFEAWLSEQDGYKEPGKLLVFPGGKDWP